MAHTIVPSLKFCPYMNIIADISETEGKTTSFANVFANAAMVLRRIFEHVCLWIWNIAERIDKGG